MWVPGSQAVCHTPTGGGTQAGNTNDTEEGSSLSPGIFREYSILGLDLDGCIIDNNATAMTDFLSDTWRRDVRMSSWQQEIGEKNDFTWDCHTPIVR